MSSQRPHRPEWQSLGHGCSPQDSRSPQGSSQLHPWPYSVSLHRFVTVCLPQKQVCVSPMSSQGGQGPAWHIRVLLECHMLDRGIYRLFFPDELGGPSVRKRTMDVDISVGILHMSVHTSVPAVRRWVSS